MKIFMNMFCIKCFIDKTLLKFSVVNYRRTYRWGNRLIQQNAQQIQQNF